MDAEPTYTTVPDAAGGRRTFHGLLALVCVLALAGLGYALYRAFTRTTSPDVLARSRFTWDHRFVAVRASDSPHRTEAFFKPTGTLKPGEGVQALFDMNYYILGAPPRRVTPKPAKALPTRIVTTGSVGDHFGVEYDAKRREYRMWWEDKP